MIFLGSQGAAALPGTRCALCDKVVPKKDFGTHTKDVHNVKLWEYYIGVKNLGLEAKTVECSSEIQFLHDKSMRCRRRHKRSLPNAELTPKEEQEEGEATVKDDNADIDEDRSLAPRNGCKRCKKVHTGNSTYFEPKSK